MKKLFAIFVLFVASTFAAVDPLCDNTGAWSDSDFNSLVAGISGQTFESDKIAYLTSAVSNSNQGFVGSQIAALLHLFTFDSSLTQITSLLSPYCLALSCNDTALILSQFSFESSKLSALSTLANLIIRDDIAQNNQTIINMFVFTSNKQQALNILANAKSRSCVYGPITQAVVQFLVDVSGSMNDPITINGVTYSKLSYIQHELNQVIRYQLSPSQQFNMFAFADRVVAWQPGVQYASPANINSAVQWVSVLKAGGGTGTFNALKYAFADPKTLGIYLLTDGQPTDATQAQIVAAVGSWESAKNPVIPLSCTAFGADPNAKQFLQILASKTGGIYRAIG